MLLLFMVFDFIKWSGKTFDRIVGPLLGYEKLRGAISERVSRDTGTAKKYMEIHSLIKRRKYRNAKNQLEVYLTEIVGQLQRDKGVIINEKRITPEEKENISLMLRDRIMEINSYLESVKR